MRTTTRIREKPDSQNDGRRHIIDASMLVLPENHRARSHRLHSDEMREVIEDLARAGAQAPAEEAAIPAQESAEEARQLLATGAGHRCHLGDPRRKGAARRPFFVSRGRRHGAERPGRVPGLPPQLQAEIARDEAGADVAAAARVCASCWARSAPISR